MSYTVYARITDIFILTISTPAQQQVRKKMKSGTKKEINTVKCRCDKLLKRIRSD